MKKNLFCGLILLSLSHISQAATNQQNELSAAQMDYQSLLKSQANDRNDIVRLHSRLKTAESRLEAAQLEVNKIRAELLLREEAQQQHATQLKQAGERLDKAWKAMYGTTTAAKVTEKASAAATTAATKK